MVRPAGVFLSLNLASLYTAVQLYGTREERKDD